MSRTPASIWVNGPNGVVATVLVRRPHRNQWRRPLAGRRMSRRPVSPFRGHAVAEDVGSRLAGNSCPLAPVPSRSHGRDRDLLVVQLHRERRAGRDVALPDLCAAGHGGEGGLGELLVVAEGGVLGRGEEVLEGGGLAGPGVESGGGDVE